MKDAALERLLRELGQDVDPRTKAAMRELPPLQKHLHGVSNYVGRMTRHDREHPGFWQSFEAFAASLKHDWTRLRRTPRQQVRKRVKAVKAACDKAARLMRKYEDEYLLWFGLPVSALALEADLAETLHHAAQSVAPEDVLVRMLHTGDPSAPAFPLVARALGALSESIDVRALPVALQILPTKLGGKEARGVYFVRALTWFVISKLGKPDDEIVSIVASHLSDRKDGIPPDHVALLRRRLMKTLDSR